MSRTESTQVCRYCKIPGTGNYCSNCGGTYVVKRITIASILHDGFHFITHLDKGLGYTLKRLIAAPGVMQREYVEGYRNKHQKPFSTFFICATISALARYWINLALVDYYNAGNVTEGNFFHEYLILLHSLLLPLYSLTTFLLFYNSKYNYAEIVVLLLYTMGMFFLITDVIALFRLVWPDINTDYIELAALGIYNAITLINFFNDSNKWWVFLKSIVSVVILYFVANYAQDFVISLLKH